MRSPFLYFFFLLSFIGCKTAPINQKVDKKRVGIWVEQYEIDSTKYKSIGVYKKDNPIKKWRYYTNGVINKKEVYRKNICNVTNYYPNGKIQSKGKTKLIINSKETHWFYFGDWKYYDNDGKISITRKYENGELIAEQKSTKR